VIQVRVSGLALDQTTQSPVVLLQGLDEKSVLPIWIGQPEASAIAFQLAGQSFERPLTHDLLRIVIEGLEARVKKVLITELRGNTFFAKIHLARGDEILVIDARPSDSIALALRTQAPIFVSRELFESNSREMSAQQGEPSDDEPEDVPEDDPLKKYLDEIDPPDSFNL
jgi:bifunctional DNase/RNase